MDMSLFMTNWVWTPDWTAEDDKAPRIVYFRRAFTLKEAPASRKIRISADSRYKLYLNGSFVQKGPQKALDLKEWFVDTAELAPFLKEGENVLAVEVLRFPASNLSVSAENANDSLYRTEIPNLYVEDPETADGVNLGGRSGWKCRTCREIRVFGEDAHPAPIHAQEDVAASGETTGWKMTGYDDSSWQDAVSKLLFDIPSCDAPGKLVPRSIPDMSYQERRFAEVSAVREGICCAA